MVFVLKILLFILISLIVLFLLLLFLPVSLDLDYNKKILMNVRFCGFKIFSNNKPQKQSEPSQESEKNIPKNSDNFLNNIYKEKGLIGTVRYLSGLTKIIINKIKYILRFIKIRKLRFLLSVATPQASETAVIYGAVCSAVYPCFSALFSYTDCKAEKIDVSADFDSKTPDFKFSFTVSTILLILVIAVITGFLEYYKYKQEN